MAAARIVILGGGFAGVYTAMYLEKKLTPQEAEIHLLSRDNYLVFSPMLPEVISGSIEILHAITPIRRLCHRTLVHTREIEAIDLERKVVVTSPGIRAVPHEVPYDHLVLGLGNQLNFRGMPGVEQHAIPFKNLGDALFIRNHVIHALEEADIETDPQLKKELLTFVVAGGGFAGVEGVAELNDFVREAAESYQTFGPRDLSVVLLHSGDRILPEVKERLGIYAQQLLQKRGVEIRFNCRLAAASASEAILSTGEKIPTRTLITTVPSAPNPLVAALPGARENRGKLPVNEFLQATSMENVWGLGDCCLVPAPDAGEPGKPPYSPPTAQHAIRQAKVAAKNIAAVLHGETVLKRFDFGGLGKLGALGKYNAVAEMFDKVLVSGFPAWMMWRAVYLGKLPGWDRKGRVALDWFLDLVIKRDLVRLRTHPSEAVRHQHFEPGEYIFRQGDVGDQVYSILGGSVDVVREHDGAETFVCALGEGEVFGEMALVEEKRRNASIRAGEKGVDVLCIGRQDFAAMMSHLPGVSDAFHQVVHERLAAATANAAPALGSPAAPAGGNSSAADGAAAASDGATAVGAAAATADGVVRESAATAAPGVPPSLPTT